MGEWLVNCKARSIRQILKSLLGDKKLERMKGPQLFAACCILVVCECSNKCYYGKHHSVPATSCKQVLDIQSECYGESGFYWLKTDLGGLDYVYCDMEHSGGGWRRVVYFHSDVNTTCPPELVTEYFFNGNHAYCKKQKGVLAFGQLNHAVFVWNYDTTVKYGEIRGYANLRVRYYYPPDGFTDQWERLVEGGHIDGFELFNGFYPSAPYRRFFSYVVASTTSDRCPISGGGTENISQPGYRDNVYACDEVDLTGPMDSEGFYIQKLFDGGNCTQCPVGCPWFEYKTSGMFPNSQANRVYGRLVDTDNDDDSIYLTELELYVR